MERISNNGIKKNVYQFYPKGFDIDKDEKKYLVSSEYSNLIDTIKKNKTKLSSVVDFFLSMEKGNYILRDYSMTDIGDRCLNLQILSYEKKNFYFISKCFYISLLTPFYCEYNLKTELDSNSIGWKKLPYEISISKENPINLLANKFISKIETDFKLRRIPKKILDVKIPDLSYYDIPYGELTYFKAYFLNEIYTRL